MMTQLARFIWRIAWLAGEILIATLAMSWLYIRYKFRPPLRSRSGWLCRHARRALRVFVGDWERIGDPPASGLLVSNHVSYLDILLLAAVEPAVFVAKAEVKRWPIFGWLGLACGTVFVERGSRSGVHQEACHIGSLLDEGHLVVLFPEGTSSDGTRVLPFRSALLEPAAGGSHPVHVAHISYEMPGYDTGETVAYWGKAVFLPHLIALLWRPFVRARVRYSKVQRPATSRKLLARQLHHEVLQLSGEHPAILFPHEPRVALLERCNEVCAARE